MEKNPEELYPEIKTLGKNQVFVESVYVISKTGEGKRIPVNKILPEKEFNTIFRTMLKREHDAEDIYTISIRK